MKKILLSWYGYNSDFGVTVENGERKRVKSIAPNSPSFAVHQYHWDNYEQHILLNGNTSEKDIVFFDYMRSELQKKFRLHKITPHPLPISDVIDPTEIIPKIQKLYNDYAEYQIDVFISPGTPAMQVAWLISALNYKNRVTLFQLRPPRKSKDKTIPEKFIVNLDSSVFPTNLNIAQQLSSGKTTKPELKITKSLEKVFYRAKQVASTDDVTCLILGDNGTGKELLANYIRENSARHDKPFKAINCAAFNDELLSSELFGHKKGAFTGANSDHTGLLEVADGGTVFLDEIGDISQKMQVALLRVIQEKKILPLKATEPKDIDVRIITATNKNLAEECKKGNFRWDLYYRLKVATLKLPPLKDRGKTEIKDWINFFIDKHAKKFKLKSKFAITKPAIDALLNYPFPGNVRELENLIISLYTFYEKEISVVDLPEEIIAPEPIYSEKLADIEKEHIAKIFNQYQQNILRTAKKLDISRNTLKSKLNEYEIL